MLVGLGSNLLVFIRVHHHRTYASTKFLEITWLQVGIGFELLRKAVHMTQYSAIASCGVLQPRYACIFIAGLLVESNIT